MSDSIYWQELPCQTICNDCVFKSNVKETIECIHPEKFEVNCSTIVFCNLFQPVQEIESPCVSFGKDDGE